MWQNASICAKNAAMMQRSRRRTAAWLALSAMSLNALGPLIANAQPAVPANPQEICSATGLKHAGDAPPAGAPDQGLHASHCTLCPFNAERGAAMSVAAAPAFARTSAADPRPEFFGTPRLESPLDPTAPPRAPPFPS